MGATPYPAFSIRQQRLTRNFNDDVMGFYLTLEGNGFFHFNHADLPPMPV